jgi:hypothetical protein
MINNQPTNGIADDKVATLITLMMMIRAKGKDWKIMR